MASFTKPPSLPCTAGPHMASPEPRWCRHRRFALRCLAVFAGVWLIAAIHPKYPRDWFLENLLTAVSVPFLVWVQRKRPFSPPVNLALLAFLSLHSLGAHYTYAEVPYEAWTRAITGHSLGDLMGWDRNHFDRLVHFLYGVLVLPAVRELMARRVQAGPMMMDFICFLFITATSTLYELLEWAAVLVVDQDLGMAYLGIQGDVWDAHKDMALASLGAVISVAVSMAARRWRTRHSAGPAPEPRLAQGRSQRSGPES